MAMRFLGILLFHDGRIADARPELEQAVRLDRSQFEATKALRARIQS